MLTNLDMDVLRSLTVAIDLGGFAKAAERLGRSQSAVSLQMRKLEEQVGQPLFRKQGRNLGLTQAGEVVLDYARRILALNDEALSAARGGLIEGAVRLGLPQGFAEGWLPGVLARFGRAHPAVQIEVLIDRNAVLQDMIAHDKLDLALAFDVGMGKAPGVDVLPVGALPMEWIAGANWRRDPGAPLPLVLFKAPCIFHRAALTALDAAGIPWRIAVTSPSLAGLWAAADAGLGITLRTPANLPAHLRTLGADAGLPLLPPVDLALYVAGKDPATQRLKALLAEEVAAKLDSPLRAA